MSWSAVGGIIHATTSTFSLTPGGAGDLILLEVTTGNATSSCTGVSSSNVTWIQVGTTFTGSGNPNAASVFAGTVTSTSTQTVTLSFSGAPSTIRADGQEFSSTAGSWAIDGSQGNLDTGATNTWVSLTPSASGALYWGYAFDSGTATAGSTPGYVYVPDANGNGMAYNLSCASGVATAPVWGDSGFAFGIMVLMKETGTIPAAGPVLGQRSLPASVAVVAGNSGWRTAGHSR